VIAEVKEESMSKFLRAVALASLPVVLFAASAVAQDAKKKDDGKKWDFGKPKIEKKVIKTLKVVKVKGGVKILQLVKYTKKIHGHKDIVWFTKEWTFVKIQNHHR
jgi:hypothetical protein